MRNLTLLIFLFCTILFCAIVVSAQSATNFTGHWRQKTDSKRQHLLEIEQNGRNLLVKTVVTGTEGARSIEVKYEIGGSPTSYTGLDGDQFRSSVRRDGNALVFDTVEREDGGEIPQTSVWTLSEDGKTLQVDRSMTKSGLTSHSMATYVRQP